MYTRIRHKGPQSPLPAAGAYTDNFGDGTQTVVARANPAGWRGGPYVETQDVEIPGFRAKSAKGFVFMNPFESVSENRVFNTKVAEYSRTEPAFPSETPAFFKGRKFDSILANYGTAVYYLTAAPDYYGPDRAGISARMESHSSSRDVAWNAALAEMAQSNALLLVTAAEMGKTVELVRQLAMLLRGRLGAMEYLATIRQGGKWNARTISDALMSEWLKLRYGVMTTVYEIQGVVKALTNQPKPPRVTARGKDQWRDTYTRVHNVPASSGRPPMTFVSATTIEASVKAGILYEPKLDTLQSRLGLHPSAIPESLFELIRLSFVADWFVDLSATLRALQASVYGNSLGGWITETVNAQTTHSVSGAGGATLPITTPSGSFVANFTWTTPPDGAVAHAFYTYKKRTPVSGLGVKSPSLRVRINAARAADALALCGQILRKSSDRANRLARL